ncbi:hypothetical protein DLD77_10385 [Chitinophaga alhagiae]|uniref:Outer membrane protein beta-barrel domain-containing protein n=1 Tax=Chitinophaga alhagiae TaxID=2203219 RepID=A0ABM6WDL9_9BACT|nr:outer membrane beta-barrel family protein [Chitinophaga alhagiae]AWO02074.1 hypothetical protein DLD77_10385 [Chitinophaga alhagiae]
MNRQAAAQQTITGHVKGVVTDSNGKPLELAVVTLLRQQDSAMVKGAMSNMDGTFELTEVAVGRYLVQAAYMGYHHFRSAAFTINAANSTANLGMLRLQLNEQVLGAVTVTGRKPLVEQRTDRTVLNIEHSLLAEGNTALELLEKAPGVTVDDNGNISLKGRPGVTVMLNGKLTYLSQQELMHLLRGTTSGSVASIEIIPNPPARYDASGTAGIINIVLKKSARQGLNGNVYTNYARSRANRYGAGASLNYGGERANVYLSYNHAFRGEVEYLQQTRRFRDSGHTGPPDRVSDQQISTNEPLYTNNFKLGADYRVNKKNTVGLLVNGNIGTYDNNSQTGNQLTDAAGELIYDAATRSALAQRWANLSSNINYTRQFNRPGQELSADLDYSYNDFSGKQELATRYTDKAGEEWLPVSTRRGSIPSRTNVYVAKADYTQTFWGTARLEAGWKSSYVEVDNHSLFDTLRNNQWVNDGGTSNHFRYKETIHAAYVQAGRHFGSWHVQLGLRGEHTQTAAHQLTTDTLASRRYFQLFPSLAVSRELAPGQKLQFTYSRRIERPDYDEMNPFRVYRDPYLFYQGNPLLQPALTHATELSYGLNNKLTAAVFYNHTGNVVNWVMGQVDALNISYEQPQNLKSMINYGVSLNASLALGNWWTGNYFFDLFHTAYKGQGATAGLQTKNTGYTFNLQNAFQLGRGFSAELTAYYKSSAVYGMFVTRPFYIISAGLQKQFLNNRFTAKAVVNDILQSRQNRYSALFDHIDVSGRIRFDSRMATFSLSYRFGTQKAVKERKSGSEEIRQRVKSGG